MLNVLRRQAGSWVVKILMLLLVVSFGIWGIGDVFFGRAANPAVAKVGGSEIPASELSEAFNRSLSSLQRRIGSTIDREQAIQLGVMQQALQDLIARRLVDLAAHDMGLTVADDTLRGMITDDPLFQSGGQFDRARFEQLLAANGLNEKTYLASLRQDIVRSRLTGSLTGPVKAPTALVDAIYRYRNEQRRGHLVRIAADSITDLPQPTDEELAAYLEAHQQQFTTAQLRKLTFVTLTAEDLLDEVEVGESEIEDEYQTRMARYRTPERRKVAQLLAPDKATIEKAADQVGTGASFADVAQALSGEGVSTDQLGELRKDDLPPETADAIFALGEGEVSAPVETPFGWHLFKVEAIEPEEVVPLAEVHDEIEHDLALDQARERLPGLAVQLDDQLAAESGIGEAAGAVGLTAKSATIDAQGNGADGKRPEGVPDWPEFNRVAFDTAEGEISLLEETDSGGYFVLQVDEVTPSHVQALDEVRPKVVEGWQADKRRELARERAQALLDELRDGRALEQLAAEQGLTVTAVEPVKRADAGSAQSLNRAVVGKLFATEPGHVADEVVELNDGFAVVATDEVIPADPTADPAAVERLRSELENDMRGDLLAQYEAQLREDYPVELDGAAINHLIAAGGDLPSQPQRPLPSDAF